MPGNFSASEILISLIWAIIVEPDTNVSESEIDQISLYLKHENRIKIARNFSASEILMSLLVEPLKFLRHYLFRWAIIVEPDTIFSEDDSYEISLVVNQM